MGSSFFMLSLSICSSFCFNSSSTRPELNLGVAALLAALLLNLHHFVQGGNERLVGRLAASRCPRCRAPIPWRSRWSPSLRFCAFLRSSSLVISVTSRCACAACWEWVHAQRQNHLALPEWDGVDDGGLDLLAHQRVVVLHQAELWGHLDGDHRGSAPGRAASSQSGRTSPTGRLPPVRPQGGWSAAPSAISWVNWVERTSCSFFCPARMYIDSSLK